MRSGTQVELPGYPVVAVNAAIDTIVDLGNVDRDAMFQIVIYATVAAVLTQMTGGVLNVSDPDTGVYLVRNLSFNGLAEVMLIFSRGGCVEYNISINPENNIGAPISTPGFTHKRLRIELTALGVGNQGNVEVFAELAS